MNPATPQDDPRVHSSDCIFAERKVLKPRRLSEGDLPTREPRPWGWADHWGFWLVSALVIAAAFYLLANPPYWR